MASSKMSTMWLFRSSGSDLRSIGSRILSGIALVALGIGILVWPVWSGVIILLAALLIVGLINPRVILYLGIIFTVFEKFSFEYFISMTLRRQRISLMLALSFIILVFAFLVWLAAKMADNLPREKCRQSSLVLPMFTIYASALVAILWSPYPFDAMRTTIFSTECMLCFFLMTRLFQTVEDVHTIFKFFIGLGLSLVVMVIATFFTKMGATTYPAYECFGGYIHFMGPTFPRYEGLRETLMGFTNGPKRIIMILNFAIPFAVAFLAIGQKRGVRIFLIASIIIMLSVEILSLSRADTMGLFMGWLLFVYLHPQWKQRFFLYQFKMAAIVAASLLLCVTLLYNFYSLDELSERFYLGSKSGSGTTAKRTTGQKSAKGWGGDIRAARWKSLMEHAWETCGIGAGNSGTLRSLESTGAMDSGSVVTSFYFEHGYGLLSFLLMFWVSINALVELRNALQRWWGTHYYICLSAICWIVVCYGFSSLLDHNIYDVKYWQLLAIIAVSTRIAPFQTDVEKSSTRTFRDFVLRKGVPAPARSSW